ncbi:MAG: slipin family protein [Candidatus Hydrothermarchaeaceae archaeon]
MVGLFEAGLLIIIAFSLISSAVKIVREYERGVIFRLGRLVGAKGPGLFFIIPIIDKMIKVDLRVITFNVPAQDVITKDNVPAKVDAVVYFRIMKPTDAIVQVEHYFDATSLISQTTLRSVLGQSELDELLAEREKINTKLQEIIDEQTEPWGIKVTNVEIKDVELPENMKRAMARQAEAERERRAKVIAALGESQAAEKLSEAAEIIGKHPAALQLRFLQTVVEASSERASTLVIPVPIDILEAFMKKGKS